MIITLASFKGGVGKTTTAVHIADYLQEFGPTLLIDGDPNRSALNWSKRGSLSFKVYDQLAAPKHIAKYEHVVIDTAARPNREDLESLSEGADLLILPTTPTALALDALVQSLDTLDDIDATYQIVLTMIPSAPRNTGDKARASLKKLGAPLLGQGIRTFAAYEKASLAGVTVGEVKRDRNAGIAAREMRTLAGEVVSLVGLDDE